MAEEYDTDARDRKAWKRTVSASRTLAKQIGKPELGDEVANASHQDASTQSMRRSEAIASLLEGLAGDDKGNAKTKAGIRAGSRAQGAPDAAPGPKPATVTTTRESE